MKSFRALVVAATLATALTARAARAQRPLALNDSTTPPAQVITLWPAGAPGAVGDSSVDRPTLAVYPPTAPATGAAVIVFPGGGYSHIATGKEGVLSARWLATLGVTTFVVRYRLGPRYHHPAMLQDGLRAVRTVRARASEWHLDPARVAILGFSAGGHLASTIGTHWNDTVSDARPRRDAIDGASARPDLMLLVYPVVTMDSALTHRTTRRNVIGDVAPPALVALLSSERQVTPRTPPTFLVGTTDDAAVPIENSILLYRALRDAKVPVELHVFESGRHGFGTAIDNPYLAQWMPLAASWLRRHGWLSPGAASAP